MVNSPEAGSTTHWSSQQLRCIAEAVELEIDVRRPDGSQRGRWTPIWVVVSGQEVLVRTWYRRDTGWFGWILDSRRALVRVPGLEAEVAVEDLGEAADVVLDDVDAAYQHKYGERSVADMVSARARATTLRLSRWDAGP